MKNRQIVLFGATGYTGKQVARELVAKGLAPVLCGRSREKLDTVAGELGSLKTAIADVENPAGLAALVNKGDILISTVGPFAKYGKTAVSVAVEKGAIYIDSTGEPSFIAQVFETYGPLAEISGAALLCACGYDYIPGNCAAGIALSASGKKAVRVDVGYYSKKNGRVRSLDMSQGTASSLRLAMIDPVKVWQSGRLVDQTGGIRTRTFDLDGKAHPGLTVSCTEHFSLPRVFPELREINTYLGWFAGKTYIMQKAALFQSVAGKIPGYRPLARAALSLLPESKGKGPGPEALRQHETHVVAETFDEKGRLLARADVVGIDGYSFTAKMIAWAAHRAATQGFRATGAVGPIEAFDMDGLIEACEACGLKPSVHLGKG